MWKKILLTIVVVLVVAVLGLVGVVAMQPSTFHIERSATMAATPEKVFEQVNSFHKWNDWSPWLDLDPYAKNSFAGPDSGKDAAFHWSGNDQVGEGSMTILESKPHELVKIRLDFVKPFEDTALTQFTLKPAKDDTTVTWSMDGKHTFISKFFCLFMDMDEMIGSKYEEGLARIKKIVESPAAEESPDKAAEAASNDP